MMYLEELIKWLEQQNPKMIVKDGFGSPHSDRGDYSDLAFTPMEEASIGDMLKYAKSALGATFTGWKGGDFKMDQYTKVHVGYFGECGDEITPIHFKYWLLTGLVEDKMDEITKLEIIHILKEMREALAACFNQCQALIERLGKKGGIL